MYSIDSHTGADLPNKTLCITFDDGPGEYSYDIGKFLFEEGIKATFFVVGKYAFEHPDILQSLKDWGHLIGNHTYEHPDMPYYLSVNGDVQDQIIRTDTVIKKYIDSDITYFRSPYGKWSAEVASDLNANLMATLNHVGPIHWDVGGIDCYYWFLHRSVEDACAEYYKDIREKKKGIIVFHDDISDMDTVKPRNKTLLLLKLLIPKLKNDGYNFVRLDSIESIKQASNKNLTFHLKTTKHRCISIKKDSGSIIYSALERNKAEALTIQNLSHGKIAIRTSNNFYLYVDGQSGNKVLADKKDFEEVCLLDLIPVSNNRFMLRASNGNYLKFNKENQLVAEATYMRNGDVFSYHPINLPAKTSLSLEEKFSLLKKKLLFIKSKLTQ